ncbi:MAG: enoyl-CoA hydratase/isomerase family protein [Candidatus Eisenbacteria bacterium]|nr:enoyl-CoA hydratase/isomerase family protein [Candidatus Eisenbacteria bacterium]
MSYRNIQVERDGILAVVTVNRPDALNALDTTTMSEINEAMKELGVDDGVAAVIVTGAGKAFVAGADIVELSKLGAMKAREASRLGQETFSRIENLPKPVVAALNGFALGGGLELAMACDIRIASTKAKLGQPEVKLGVTPGFAGTQRLPRLVGLGRALEMLLVGEPIDAETALRYGLVTKVVEPDALMAAAKELALTIASRGPAAVALIKACVVRGVNADIEVGGSYESETFGTCFALGEAQEGIRAFLEKRTPSWSRKKS